jgi:hypothetical protein
MSAVRDEIAACAADAKYFAVRHCMTTDPWDGGRVKLLPPYPFALDYLDRLSRRGNAHVAKSRKMLASWLGPAWFLWALAFRPHFAGLMTSRKQSLVDDGGEASTQDSLFGRLRFMWEALDEDIRARIPLRFALCRIANVETGGSLRGEATGPNAGRGGTYDRALLDEAAYVPQSEQVHRALHLSCPDGKVYQGTPDGPGNMFARLHRERPAGWDFLRLHWTAHPDRWDGAEVDVDTGLPSSAWYRAMCFSMTPDQVARELDISFEHSAHGLVYPEFSFDVHGAPSLVYDPDLPLHLGVDPGIGAPTAGVFFQVHGAEMRVLADYEQANAPVEVNARNLASMARRLGFEGDVSRIHVSMDPAANAREMVRGSTVIREYRSCGFENIATPRVKVADGIRMLRRKLHRREVFVSPDCDVFAQRIAGYRYPTDDEGNVKGDEPVHDICSHMMDAFRYGATSAFPLDESGAPMREAPRPHVRANPLDSDIGWARGDAPIMAPIGSREW